MTEEVMVSVMERWKERRPFSWFNFINNSSLSSLLYAQDAHHRTTHTPVSEQE
jgi:hypothetical protein